MLQIFFSFHFPDVEAWKRKAPGTGCIPVTFHHQNWCLHLLEVPLSWMWDQETKNSNWLLFTSNFFLFSAKDNEEVGIEEHCATSFSQDTERTTSSSLSLQKSCQLQEKAMEALKEQWPVREWESCWTTVAHGIGLWDFNAYLFSVIICYWKKCCTLPRL